MLAYGGVVDSLDDPYKMSESTVLKTLNHFVSTVIELYEKEYLRLTRPRELEIFPLQDLRHLCVFLLILHLATFLDTLRNLKSSA
jgi:hypothetical protein